MIVQHGVTDYAAWRQVFDGHGSSRTAHGCTGVQVFRGIDDANAITALISFPNADQAKAFASDPSLKEAMSKAGVTGPPQISFVEASN
ncbi:MAG: cyclase [Actinomycetota bacterium]